MLSQWAKAGVGMTTANAPREGDGKQVTVDLHFEPFPIFSFFLAGSHEPCLV